MWLVVENSANKIWHCFQVLLGVALNPCRAGAENFRFSFILVLTIASVLIFACCSCSREFDCVLNCCGSSMLENSRRATNPAPSFVVQRNPICWTMRAQPFVQSSDVSFGNFTHRFRLCSVIYLSVLNRFRLRTKLIGTVLRDVD